MATLLDSMVEQYAKPVDVSGIAEGSMAGMQMGLEIASRKQQMQMQMQELQFKRQQLEAQKQEHMTGLVDKIATTDDPAIRNVLLKHAQKVGQNLGYPLSDDFLDTFSKSDQLRQAWMIKASQRNLLDPQDRMSSLADSTGTMMGGPDKIMKLMDDATKQQSDIIKTQITANAMAGKPAAAGMQQRINEALKAPNLPISIRQRLSYGDATALSEAAPYIQQYKTAQFSSTQGKTAAQTQQIGAQTQHLGVQDDVLQQNADSTRMNAETNQGKLGETTRHDQAGEAHNKVMEGIAKQRVQNTAQQLQLAGKRLNLSQQTLLENTESKIEKMPTIQKSQDNIQFADNALSLLRPGMKWIDMHDVAAEMNKMMTGTSRAAFQGEDRRTFTDLSTTFSKWQGKIEGNETGGPTDTEINIFRDRIQRIQDSYARQHDNVYKRVWQGKVATGLVPAALAGAHFEANKLSQNSTWNMTLGNPALGTNQKAALRAGVPNGSPPPVPAGAPSGGASIPGTPPISIDTEKQKATAAIQAIRSGKAPSGVTEQMVRQKFKQKTNVDLDFK